MQYFTVKNYGPGDLAGSVSAQTGIDDEGTAWACVKFLDGATLPFTLEAKAARFTGAPR